MSWEQTADDVQQRQLRCPVCGSVEFDKEEGRIDSRWGFSSHKIVMMVCRTCGLVLQFSAGRGIFDFD